MLQAFTILLRAARQNKVETGREGETFTDPWTLLNDYNMLYESGKVGYNAILNLITSSWDTCHPLFQNQSIFYFHTSVVNHFRNKIVSA